jgi:hypothetical protein
VKAWPSTLDSAASSISTMAAWEAMGAAANRPSIISLVFMMEFLK